MSRKCCTSYILATTGKKSYELKEGHEALRRVDLALVRRLLRLAVILSITADIVEEAYNIASEYGLPPNDALIAATCRHYGVRSIATFDKGFEGGTMARHHTITPCKTGKPRGQENTSTIVNYGPEADIPLVKIQAGMQARRRLVKALAKPAK